MLTVEEIFDSAIGFRHNDVEVVSGFLIVSEHLSYLCPSFESREKAILVIAPGLIEKWIKEVPAYAGSMVIFLGEATVTGRVAKSGLDPCPYVFYQVASIQFRSKGGIDASYEAAIP